MACGFVDGNFAGEWGWRVSNKSIDIQCPNCGDDLKQNDTFGNLDYCLDAIGHPRDAYSQRKPQKAGEIYRCERCEQYWHSFDSDGELRIGYPC